MAGKVTVIPPSRTKKRRGGEEAKKKRVAAYCRVSTDHEEQLGSFANQVSHYRSLIEGNPDYELAGIFADEGISGTGTKNRSGFLDMVKACEEGRVDMVITKSISRFARNTADCLHYARHLKNLGIGIRFEKEGIDTMDSSGELLFTILSSLAQEESRNISENTAWGIRSKFKKGIPHINAKCLLGYDKGEDGGLVIVEEEATTVRRIYREYLEGWNVTEIADRLNREGVPGVHGEARWCSLTIARMLRNEKYCGDMLMQKTYTADFLTKTTAQNDGDLEQYFIRDDHPAIIAREEWDAVQDESLRREEFNKSHGVQERAPKAAGQFSGRVFCGCCGGRYIRRYWKGIRSVFWKCQNTDKKHGHSCAAGNIREEDLRSAFVIAWNGTVERRDEFLPRWEKDSKSEDGLKRLRARQMVALTGEEKLDHEVPELTRMVLEQMVVHPDGRVAVRFLDGTETTVVL